MPFVIGAGTFITGDFSSGIQSINFSQNPQIQRLYQLGAFTPFDKNVITQSQLSIVRYSGQGGPFSVIPNTSCVDASSVRVNIAAGNCNDNVSISDDFWITSYSYSKDVQGWGTESFSLISKPSVELADGVNTVMYRGTAEGQTTSNGGANTGITFLSDTTQEEGQTIEVSAGSSSLGKAFEVLFGEIATVGGGTGKAIGLEGNASVSIPYTTLYVPL